ncbi:MAG: aminotransferase class V-fold PLP-dependent enzyme [Bryobacter sp.]|nr:aminotransferase class V-fold PLP-dependent enzyme [Bryobacter sp.]
MKRRQFLGTATALLASQNQSAAAPQDFDSLPDLWDVDRNIANLENAYWGVMPREVAAEYQKQTAFLNRQNILFVRDGIPGNERTLRMEEVRAKVGRLLGAPAKEFALARNGTEALQNLILQYRRLSPGDAVMYADLDYDEMQQAMDSLRQRRGAKVLRFNIPEPATTANILDAYAKQLKSAPANLKLLLLTHLSNRTGIVMPVKEIAALARARGVDTIVDAAQTVAHVDFQLADLGVDFVGFSLHKWLNAPIGTGGIWIRESRLADIEPCMGSTMFPEDDTRCRTSLGTINFAATLTVPAAIAFHERLGPARKFRHLQALRRYWVERVRDLQGIEILTPEEPARYAAVTSFRFPGIRDYTQAQRLAAILLHKHRVLTVARRGIAAGAVIRVSPALYNHTAELDRLVGALRQEFSAFV